MTKVSDQQVIKATQNWVQEFIIPNNICPFAYKEIQNQSTRFIVHEHSNTEETLFNIINELAQLDIKTHINSTLLILKQGVDDFDDFLLLLHLANQLLTVQNYKGIYQLASFHPNYQFEGTQLDDAENFTNRSPYPVIHILRETAVEQARLEYKNIEAIPEKNIKKLNQIGFEELERKFKKILQT